MFAIDKRNVELIILDRDGVINYDSKDYIKSPAELTFIPGSITAIAKLKHAGFKIALATNQSGIARGYFTTDALTAMHNKISDLLKEHNATIDAINYCPHLPNANCLCRKPLPKLLTRAMSQLKINNTKSIMVGDSEKDLAAAENAACNAALVLTGNGKETYSSYPNIKDSNTFANLAEFVEQLLAQ
jgi:D-glycero-D-manno-heptose 1,7-bisphosphate phosphatase